MKTKIYLISAVAALLVQSCYFDYKDVDTLTQRAAQSSTMTLDVRVAGSMVGSYAALTEDEMSVADYDLFVFNTTSEGSFLEYVETGIMPSKTESVKNSADISIDSKQIELPSSGTKRVLLVANAIGAKVQYPELTTLDNSLQEDRSDVTTYESFRSGLHYDFAKGKTLSAPFLMTGETLIASSVDAELFVRLTRQCARMDVVSGSPDVKITKVAFSNAPRSCYPFVNDFNVYKPDFVEYPVMSGEATAYFLYTPGLQTKTEDLRIAMKVNGTVGTEPFEKEIFCPDPMYPDYNIRMTLRHEDGVLNAYCTPDWSAGSFTVSGIMLRGGKFTFPFLADKNWGYELNWSTNLSGDVEVEQESGQDWFSTKVEEGFVRVCCLSDNYTGSDRTGSFKISLGKYSYDIAVVQQAFTGATVKFNGWEWMDRTLGATLPLTEANILNSDTYGYYYQWGRNVPFPTYGTVATVPADASRTIAQAQSIPEFITGDSNLGYEWLTIPPVPGDRKTTWKDRTGGTDPCPPGYHVPSYMEYQTILPYTNGAGIGNFTNVVTALKSGEIFEGKEYDALYVTSGYEEATIYAIKRYKTEEAYYLRLRRALSNGTPYLRIDAVKGDANSDYAGGEDAAAVLASAKSFWSSAAAAGMESLFFPACGRRSRGDGTPANQGLNLTVWSATTWDASSSSPYFDAIGSNNRIYNMANNRSHAFPVRCLKDYD